MDINQELKNTENALRDFIANLLQEKHGESWIEESGVSKDRIALWQKRMEIDRLSNDKRLIYYSDFYDLFTILRKHWGIFKDIFLDLKTTEVYLTLLDGFRNTDAHRREMLPHQISLVEGVCGEIRTKLVKYRSKKETGKDCFARFEFAQDNLGNSWKIGDGVPYVKTDLILRPGDCLEFVVTASDPEGAKLQYSVMGEGDWGDNNKFTFVVQEKDIGKNKAWIILVKSSRPYHADSLTKSDDSINFIYDVLPKQK